MPIADAPPFQYALRGTAVSSDAFEAQAHEQRDRDLEDFLKQLAQWVSYTPAGGAKPPWTLTGAYWLGTPTGGTQAASGSDIPIWWNQSAASGFTQIDPAQVRCDVAGWYLVSATISWPQTTAVVYLSMDQVRGGTVIYHPVWLAGAGAGQTQMHGDWALNLAAGDLVRINVNPNASIAVSAQSSLVIVPAGGTKGDKGDPGLPGATGPQGPPGAGGASSYRHVQSSAATTWTVPHNLGYRPNVTAVDSTGHQMYPGDMTYPDVNTVQLTFSAAVGGEAYAS